jgi:acyl carrier protein
MDINTFIEKMTEQYDDGDGIALAPGSKFKDVKGWSSLIALSVISMIDEEYNVSVSGNDIRSSETIEDLFNMVKSRA